MLQAILSSRSGQESPPFCDSLMTSRTRVLVPPLQVALHSLQAFQSPTLQSTDDQHLERYFDGNKNARNLQDAQAEKLTSLQAKKLIS